MKILTLCEKCQQLMSAAYDVKPYVLKNATTQTGSKCDNCGKPYRIQLKLYTIDKKRG